VDKSKRTKQYQLVDIDTGEIKGVIDNPYPEPMTEDGYRFPAHKRGARVFADIAFPESMSYTEIGRMTMLSKRMIAKTNMLGYRQGKEVKAYTDAEIGGLVGLNDRSKRQAFLNRMLRIRIMHKVRDSGGNWQYYINPAYYMSNGQRLNYNLFLLFKDDLTPILPDWVLNEFLTQAGPKMVLASDAISEVESIIDP